MYWFSRIILVSLILNGSRLIASITGDHEDSNGGKLVASKASSQENLGASVTRGRDPTLGPTLDDVPSVITLDLFIQNLFEENN